MAELEQTKKITAVEEVVEEDFETAVAKLEDIINEIEEGKVSLEDSIKRYQDGMRLITQCQKKLAEVEQQIKILDQDSGDLKNYQ